MTPAIAQLIRLCAVRVLAGTAAGVAYSPQAQAWARQTAAAIPNDPAALEGPQAVGGQQVMNDSEGARDGIQR